MKKLPIAFCSTLLVLLSSPALARQTPAFEPVTGAGFCPRCPADAGEDQLASPVSAACDAELLDEETVVRVNAGYESTLRASDVDALQRILAPDFMFITSGGEIRGRQELLRSYGAREVDLRVLTSENVRVRFRGNVSILTADVTKEGDYLTGPRAGAVFTGRYRITRVYACSSEGWQLVSTHESQLSM
jgi:ketosteroid isomerase-like protein